jgi:hypothetical protein
MAARFDEKTKKMFADLDLDFSDKLWKQVIHSYEWKPNVGQFELNLW